MMGLFLPFAVSAAEAQYYVTMFSYQSRFANRPLLSHSFARFVKVENGRITDSADISWLPAGQHASPSCLIRPGVQDGHNYALQETFDIVNRCHLRPQAPSGPYPIAPWVFQSAKEQEAKLCAHEIQYRLVDNRENPAIQNCLGAIAWVVGKKKTLFKRGGAGTAALVDFYAKTGAITYLQAQPWLTEQVLSYQPPPNACSLSLPQPPVPHRRGLFPRLGRPVFGRAHN